MIRKWPRTLIPSVTFATFALFATSALVGAALGTVLLATSACGSTEPADETTAAAHESSMTNGGGDTVLDTETSGFEGASPTTSGDEWPSELTGLVPQPEGCSITELETMGEFDYLITCSVPGDQPLDDYVALLLSQGFAAVTQETAEELDSFLFQKGDFFIDVSAYSPGQLDICITDDASYVCPVEDD